MVTTNTSKIQNFVQNKAFAIAPFTYNTHKGNFIGSIALE
jgi:hypothetical protein